MSASCVENVNQLCISLPYVEQRHWHRAVANNGPWRVEGCEVKCLNCWNQFT